MFYFSFGEALFYGVFCSIVIHKQTSINNGGGQAGREEERVSRGNRVTTESGVWGHRNVFSPDSVLESQVCYR